MLSPLGYELIPLSEEETDTRGVYREMLTEFVMGRFREVQVNYPGRDVQAIYMGLRNARKTEAPIFDGVRIRKEGSTTAFGRVILSK